MTPTDHNFAYKNITISGLPGSGSTTLLNQLREALTFDGFTGYSGGAFMRAYAAEQGLLDPSSKVHHSATVYSDDFDREVDYGMREKMKKEDKLILESWLSGFLAQQIPGVLKVLMVCSNDAVRVDRIVNRDEITADEALKHIHQRYADNLAKWQRMYANEWHEWVVEPGTVPADKPIDFWRPELYDIVVDTYSTNQQESLQIVLDAIKKK